ncbi:MAG TPA: hypothetical protein VMD30_08990, partial [Tepidisphaeraceae bacterium]|nr:hypothetical protein [Tepidisphaeraceae bacterium]
MYNLPLATTSWHLLGKSSTTWFDNVKEKSARLSPISLIFFEFHKIDCFFSEKCAKIRGYLVDKLSGAMHCDVAIPEGS